MLSLSEKNQTDVNEAFNFTSKYLNDLLNIDIPYIEQMVGHIYPIKHYVVGNPQYGLSHFLLQQRQNLGRRYGAGQMHLGPWWFWLLSILRQRFCCS